MIAAADDRGQRPALSSLNRRHLFFHAIETFALRYGARSTQMSVVSNGTNLVSGKALAAQERV